MVSHLLCRMLGGGCICELSPVSVWWVDIPFIQPCQFVLALLRPRVPPLEVVLVVKPATHVASSGDPGGDIFPLHALTSQLDEDDIFLGGPGALPLCGGLFGVRGHTSFAASYTAGRSIRR